MKLTKRIIKWSMTGMPILIIVIGFVMVTSNPLIDPFDIGIISGQLVIVWLFLSLGILGLLKIIEKTHNRMEAKHEN